MSKLIVFSVLVCLSGLMVVDAGNRAASSVMSGNDVKKESQRIKENIHGRMINLKSDGMGEANVREIFGSPREGRSIHRKDPPAERYPSPHGKDARWRFDLRHTVDAELSRGASFSFQPNSLQRGILHARAI